MIRQFLTDEFNSEADTEVKSGNMAKKSGKNSGKLSIKSRKNRIFRIVSDTASTPETVVLLSHITNEDNAPCPV